MIHTWNNFYITHLVKNCCMVLGEVKYGVSIFRVCRRVSKFPRSSLFFFLHLFFIIFIYAFYYILHLFFCIFFRNELWRNISLTIRFRTNVTWYFFTWNYYFITWSDWKKKVRITLEILKLTENWHAIFCLSLNHT